MEKAGNTRLKHAILTQAHRWFQYYERVEKFMNNQIDIVTDGLYFKSGIEESRGRGAYVALDKKVPAHWKHSHFLQDASVKQIDAETVALEMEVIYQNIGALPRGSLSTTLLHYSALLKEGYGFLPKFSEIIIEDKGTVTAKQYASFKDNYPENRLKSLVHYWLLLIESKPVGAAAFKQILADEIHFTLSGQICKSYGEFDAWIQSASAKLAEQQHSIERFETKTLAPGSYSLQMEILHSSGEREEHTWQVIDDPKESFARVRSIVARAL